MYYETLNALAEKYDRTPKEYAFRAKTQEEHKLWQAAARKRLWEITGLNDCEKVEANPQKLQSWKMEGYEKEYWLMSTEPSIQMPYYLLRPDSPNGSAVLALHGHGGGKETTIGDQSKPNVAAHAEWFGGPTLAEELVQEGYIVVCPDERGSGDRREIFEQGDTAEDWSACSHRELEQIALCFGQSMVGLAVWDFMRLVDVIEQMPEVKEGRIACAGFSGGGQMTLWLAALDDRIRVAVQGGYFYGMRDSLLLMPNNCACNFVPFMWKTMDMGDLGALIAPRPLLVENGETDPLNGHRGIENVYEQFEITKKAYALYGREEHVIHRSHPEGHVWHRLGVKEFLAKELG